MKMKMKKITLALAVASVFGTSSTVFAAADAAGDSLINLPKNETSVTTASVDVWFTMIDKASAYTVDLVGAAKNTSYANVGTLACDNTSTSQRTYEKKITLSASSLDCGEETASTKPGDTDLSAIHLCKWTTPNLADGTYAIAINPVFTGDTSLFGVAELRTATACTGDDDSGAAVANTSTGDRIDNVAISTIGPGNNVGIDGSNENYQRFKVAVGAGNATAIPATPVPLLPAAGAALPGNDKITFVDNSSSNNLSTWYELWIYDKNNKRVNTFSDNPTFKHWYKNTVDSELACTTTNALGNRLCEIDLSGSIVADAGTSTDTDGGATVAIGDTITWWIKGYNSKGGTSWSSAATFKAN